ncbi:uncharacterized protein C3orf38 homolog [Oryzias melastigma]|uniref:NTF2 domain-containing protein n=1 Tax=Oryzias melastigma TaxID=30732 RepID=A0A3B3CUB4_ORYME|nr:uncharacterized protein C3orf38 homolog [Oryzias melastigma]
MSGLSTRERVGLKKILDSMETCDLLSLNDTVTNRLIRVENVAEAKEAILSFSKNAEELLKRRKVQRDLIFKYLVSEGVKMLPSSDKHQLVTRTLELWSSDMAPVKALRPPKQPQATPAASDLKAEVGFDPLVMGQHFCNWFFPMLNSQNPSLKQEPQDWGPQHFWPDAKLSLVSRVTDENFEELLGAELTSLRLLSLTRDERLFLSPNLQPHGLKALASPHGLVLVAVAGTIHRDTACLGIFEQTFGLIRSPLEGNSWKIKFVNLKIRRQNALEGMDVSAPALNYNSTELQQFRSLR